MRARMKRSVKHLIICGTQVIALEEAVLDRLNRRRRCFDHNPRSTRPGKGECQTEKRRYLDGSWACVLKLQAGDLPRHRPGRRRGFSKFCYIKKLRLVPSSPLKKATRRGKSNLD